MRLQCSQQDQGVTGRLRETKQPELSTGSQMPGGTGAITARAVCPARSSRRRQLKSLLGVEAKQTEHFLSHHVKYFATYAHKIIY